MYKKIAAMILSVLLIGTVCSAAQTQEDILRALDALLIGVEYPSEESQSDPRQWSDETVCDVIYRKLVRDDSLNFEDPYLLKAELTPLPSENRYLHFYTENIQNFTRSIFRRDFPTDVNQQDIFISGDELLIARKVKDCALLRVKTVTQENRTFTAVGTAAYEDGVNSEFLGYFEATFIPSASVYGYTLTSLRAIDAQTFEAQTATEPSEVTTQEPVQEPTETTQAAETTAPAVTEEQENSATVQPNPNLNTWIWIALGAIVAGGAVCFVALIVLLKKKGSL